MANTTTIIRDVTVNFAKVYEAEKNQFGAVVFDIQLEFGKDRVAEMGAFGKVRNLPNGNFAINLSRNAVKKDGTANSIRVVDAAKEDFTAPIGNGSKANIMAYSYDWSMNGRSGRKTILTAVQIMEHVPYEPKAGTDFDVIESSVEVEAEAAVDF